MLAPLTRPCIPLTRHDALLDCERPGSARAARDGGGGRANPKPTKAYPVPPKLTPAQTLTLAYPNLKPYEPDPQNLAWP